LRCSQLLANHAPTARFIGYHRSSFGLTQEIMLAVEAVAAVAVVGVLVVVALEAFPSVFPPI
jgi:ABC-type Mn2+/Zn2+ transport system permease subunit